MVGSLPSPLGGPAPTEVLLSRSPLVRVVAQVRFASVLRIDTKEGITGFQDRIRRDYPLFEPIAAQHMQLEIGASGPVVRSLPSTVLRFSDAARTTQLSLTTETVTLEAMAYEGRKRFLARLFEILVRIEEEFAPGLALRIGLRYVNRIDDENALTRLPELVASNLIGVVQPELRTLVIQALSEALVRVEEGCMTLRWGILPPNATFDPILLAPVNRNTWLFDMDVFSDDQRLFSGAELGQLFQSLSERAYAMFRYAITPTGLKFFGA